MTEISEMIANLVAALQTSQPMKFETNLHSDFLDVLVDIALDCPEKPKSFRSRITYPKLHDRICLTSGGADSTIAWYLAGKPRGLYIDIGQHYASIEINTLNDLNIEYDLVKVPSIVPTKEWKHIIPGRNLLFLTIAAEKAEKYGKIYFSVINGEGYESNRGDKSQNFIDRWRNWYNVVTGKTIEVITMYNKTKAEWLVSFKEFGFDPDIIRHKTVTCFNVSKDKKQCGTCQACLRKYLSFIAAFKLDTQEDYAVHPKEGCKEYIEKYKVKMNDALINNDYSHYSKKRCEEDLKAICYMESL